VPPPAARKKSRPQSRTAISDCTGRGEDGGGGGRDKNSQQAAIKRVKPRQLIAALGDNRPARRHGAAIIFTTRMISSIYLAGLGLRAVRRIAADTSVRVNPRRDGNGRINSRYLPRQRDDSIPPRFRRDSAALADVSIRGLISAAGRRQDGGSVSNDLPGTVKRGNEQGNVIRRRSRRGNKANANQGYLSAAAPRALCKLLKPAVFRLRSASESRARYAWSRLSNFGYPTFLTKHCSSAGRRLRRANLEWERLIFIAPETCNVDVTASKSCEVAFARFELRANLDNR